MPEHVYQLKSQTEAFLEMDAEIFSPRFAITGVCADLR
jgi:hypothetical protein